MTLPTLVPCWCPPFDGATNPDCPMHGPQARMEYARLTFPPAASTAPGSVEGGTSQAGYVKPGRPPHIVFVDWLGSMAARCDVGAVADGMPVFGRVYMEDLAKQFRSAQIAVLEEASAPSPDPEPYPLANVLNEPRKRVDVLNRVTIVLGVLFLIGLVVEVVR